MRLFYFNEDEFQVKFEFFHSKIGKIGDSPQFCNKYHVIASETKQSRKNKCVFFSKRLARCACNDTVKKLGTVPNFLLKKRILNSKMEPAL